MKTFWIIAVPVVGLALLMGLVFAFLRQESTPVEPAAPVVRIWADEALRLVLESPELEHEQGLLGRFERRTGIRVRVTYGDLARWRTDPEALRDTDMVLTANEAWLAYLDAEGLVSAQTPFSRHVPVIQMHESYEMEPAVVAGLRDPDLRLAIADPATTDLGRWTVRLLTDESFTADDLRRQASYMGDSAEAVARAIQQNRADAGLIWRDAAIRFSLRTSYKPISGTDAVGPSVYAVQLRGASPGGGAAQLARFLAGRATVDLLQAYGFAIRNEE